MTIKPIGWAFQCKVCGDTHLMGVLDSFENQLPQHSFNVPCVRDDRSEMYSPEDFTLIFGKVDRDEIIES